MSKVVTISILTATYNRERTLLRLYDSLANQTYKDFEWIVVDDGSTDKTAELIERLKKYSKFPIIYSYQENKGKHIAINKALELCKGEYCTSIDFDDEIKSNSLEILMKEWEGIQKSERKKYKAVIARCYNPENGKLIGKPMKKYKMDCSSLDARYKYKMNYEKWGLSRTEIEKEFCSPQTKGSFYPETIVNDEAARKYIQRYIDIPLRGYYQDTSNATTKKRIKKENIFLWGHIINHNMDYFIYDIPGFIKAFVGISMCGFANSMTIRDIIKQGKGILRKIGIILFIPIGLIVYIKNKDR